MSPRSTGGYRIAVANPLSLVGKEIQQIIHERGIPYERLELVATDEEQTGALTEVAEEAAFVKPVSEELLSELDVVFFCGSAEANAPWIDERRRLGFIAIDLSVPASTEGLAVVAGINDASVDAQTDLIVSPHPVATPLAVLLHEVQKHTPVELCAATVIQPASEYGQRGIDELVQQTIGVLNVQEVKKEIFGRQLAFNLYSATEGSRDRALVLAQVRSVVGAVPLTLAIAQGTIFHGHVFSVFVRTEKEIAAEILREGIEGNAALRLAGEDESFGILDAAGENQILVDRVIADEALPRGFWVWMLSDNLRRSTALNAVAVSESLLARFHPIAQ